MQELRIGDRVVVPFNNRERGRGTIIGFEGPYWRVQFDDPAEGEDWVRGIHLHKEV